MITILEPQIGSYWSPMVVEVGNNVSEVAWSFQTSASIDLSDANAQEIEARDDIVASVVGANEATGRKWALCFEAGLKGAVCNYGARCSSIAAITETFEIPVCLDSSVGVYFSSGARPVVVSAWLQRVSGDDMGDDESVPKVGHTAKSMDLGSAREGKFRITAMLAGGLGNQLFQIFSSIAYSLDHGTDVVFHDGQVSRGPLSRSTYWATLFKYLASHREESLPRGGILLTPNDVVRVLPLPPPPFSVGKEAAFSGFFQSPKYFDHRAVEVVQRLHIDVLRAHECSHLSGIFPEVPAGASTVSIHFRIGDYKEMPGVFAVLPTRYYADALHSLGISASSKKHALIFAHDDDAQDVERHLKALRGAFPELVFHVVPSAIPDWKQLLLMSCADSHVVANSSFSWWAAYLHRLMAAGAFVAVAFPSDFFGLQPRHMLPNSDLYPIEWIEVGAEPSQCMVDGVARVHLPGTIAMPVDVPISTYVWYDRFERTPTFLAVGTELEPQFLELCMSMGYGMQTKGAEKCSADLVSQVLNWADGQCLALYRNEVSIREGVE